MNRRAFVVHVTVEGFFEAIPRDDLDALMSFTDRLDRALAGWASGWERPSADEAVLASEPPWGAEEHPIAWVENFREDLDEKLDLDCSVGIASTRVAARICSRLARPRGVLLWLDGYEDGLVGGVALEELDELHPEQLAGLRAQGIRTLGELACLDPGHARSVLGSQAAKLVGLVRGNDVSSGASSRNRISKAIDVLSRRLSRRLERCGRQARGLELRLAYGDGVVLERYTLLAAPVASPESLGRAGSRLFDMAPRRHEPVVSVSLTATGLTARAGQLALFSGGPPAEVVVSLGRPMRQSVEMPRHP